MRGWFDAFRTGGGPTLYDSERTAATHDNILLGLYATLAAVFLAFLVIIPGFRSNKIPTLILLMGSMSILASIVICQFSSHWHVSSSSILATYKHSSGLKLPGRIGVNVGLSSFNVTLQLTETNCSDYPLDHRISGGLNFNEKYTWNQVDETDRLYQESLQRGFPLPILTVAETFALDAGGFSWGRSYRLAGYYCTITLWCALASWVVMNLLFCLVPRYSGYCGLLTGGLCFLCDGIYAQLVPAPALAIRFEHGLLVFGYGWNFWMILGAGFVCLLFGVGIIIADIFFPQMISEVHASWRHTFSDSQICSPVIYSQPASGAKLSAAYLANCQITVDHSAPYGRDRVKSPPIRRSTQWTPKDSPADSQNDLADMNIDAINEDDHYLEEIDRATNLPRRTPLPMRRTTQGPTESINLISMVKQEPLDSSAAVSSSTVIRDGLGYVNPVLWDINMQEHIEDAQIAHLGRAKTVDNKEDLEDRMGELLDFNFVEK